MKMSWKQNNGRELIPEGTYKVSITRWERTTATTGTPQIRWYADIVEGPYAGQSLVEHTPLTESSSWRLAKFVAAMGVKINNLPDMETGGKLFEAVLDTCSGRTTYWHVDINTFQGRTNNKVLDYLKDKEQEQAEVTLDIEDVPDFLEHEDAKPI